MLAITLKQLETFAAVAESGGFRRAAERLNLSQSAATALIQLVIDSLAASAMDAR